MHPIATLAAALLALVAIVNSQSAIRRADESDREHAALAMRIVEVEGVLTLEQKLALDMIRTKGRK